MIYLLAKLIIALSAFTYQPHPFDLATAEQKAAEIDAALPFPPGLHRIVKLRDLPGHYVGATAGDPMNNGCAGTVAIDPVECVYSGCLLPLAHERAHAGMGLACENWDSEFIADLVAFETIMDMGEVEEVRYSLRREFVLAYLAELYKRGAPNPTLQGLELSEEERIYYLSWSRDEVTTRGRKYWSVLAERLITDDDGYFETSMGLLDARDTWRLVQEMMK